MRARFVNATFYGVERVTIQRDPENGLLDVRIKGQEPDYQGMRFYLFGQGDDVPSVFHLEDAVKEDAEETDA